MPGFLSRQSSLGCHTLRRSDIWRVLTVDREPSQSLLPRQLLVGHPSARARGRFAALAKSRDSCIKALERVERLDGKVGAKCYFAAMSAGQSGTQIQVWDDRPKVCG